MEKKEQLCRICGTYGPREEIIKVIEQLTRGEEVEIYDSPEQF